MRGRTYVSARAVDLAVVLGVVIYNIHGTATIMLADRVLGMVCTTTDNPLLLGRFVSFL